MWEVGAFAAVVVGMLMGLHSQIVHSVPEGHVGIYWRGGALLDGITGPGYHAKAPVLTQFEPVQVTVQTDKVTDIPCGTKGGVMIGFEKVEVVNRLRASAVLDTVRNYGVHYDQTWIYDKLHHEINQFCSKHSLDDVYITMFDTVDDFLKERLQEEIDEFCPGLDILSVRVTKPVIPEAVRRNYEVIEEQRTKLLAEEARQKVVEKEAETERKRAVIEAERDAETSALRGAMAVAEVESQRKVAEIQDAIAAQAMRSEAEAKLFAAEKSAEGNAKLLTREFLDLQYVQALGANSKIYFGDSIPAMFTDNHPDQLAKGAAAAHAQGKKR